ncbi:MAG: phosphotransferase family protein [Ilumatobacter sp.]|uniref:phosphotransferase family protein n=1 Tax=Ilumatobacter sp. TaxID=1967498 RepID=UPI00391D61A3
MIPNATTDATTTTDSFLAALRHHTGTGDLDWARPPLPLSGGFWAEMYDVEFVDPTERLTGRLVARIMPDPATAAFETTVQRHVHRCGLSVPAIRAAAGPGEHLDRAWSLMDYACGQPLLSGLSAASAFRQVPTLLRRLPLVLAEAASNVHRCSTEGLEDELASHDRRADVDDFLERVAHQAVSIDRLDLASNARQLATQSASTRVICHGDLHPFNLLVDDEQWTLVDWSAAVIADPHYDLAFTTLMLAKPPLGGPAPVRAVARIIGNWLANRFLRTYEQLTAHPIDPDRLHWGRQVHALRALVELHTWDAQGTTSAHAGHPWLALRPHLEAQLSTR